MRELQIGRFGKARVWINEESGAWYEPVRVAERTARAITRSERRRLAIEIFLPRGARAEYGLLGGYFVPAPDDVFKACVGVAPNGPTFNGALGGSIDAVHVGLLEEFAESVIDGLLARRPAGFIAGTFTIDEAAYGSVGSSPRLFFSLAHVLGGLLDVPMPISDDLMAAAVEPLSTRKV